MREKVNKEEGEEGKDVEWAQLCAFGALFRFVREVLKHWR